MCNLTSTTPSVSNTIPVTAVKVRVLNVVTLNFSIHVVEKSSLHLTFANQWTEPWDLLKLWKMNEAVPGGGWSGARLFFVSQRLEAEDNSDGIGGIRVHIIPVLDQLIHIGHRCCEAEDDPHGGEEEGLEPVQTLEIFFRS